MTIETCYGLGHATPVKDSISVVSAYPFEGHYWVEIHCDGYDGFTKTPAGLTFEGRTYGRTGWNSDRNIAYYCTRQSFATRA